MRYRRARVPGGTYFFTVTLADRSQTLLTDHIEPLRQSIRSVRARHPFEILAMVVLPDHLHCIWQLPENDLDYPTRWALIKPAFSRQVASRRMHCAFAPPQTRARHLATALLGTLHP